MAGETSHPGTDPTSLQHDIALRDALAAQGFAGPEYEMFEAALIKYGYRIMFGLLVTRVIFQRCREEGLHLRPPLRPMTREDCEDLAWDTVARTIMSFKRDALERGGWDPERGASLTTYFRRKLLQQFANVYRTWLGGEKIPPDSAMVRYATPDPADTYEIRDNIRRGLAILDVRVAATIVLHVDGYTDKEIAEVLGCTPKAVNARLQRHRERREMRPQQLRDESRRLLPDDVNRRLTRHSDTIEGHLYRNGE